jgi:hypothetical protein
MTESPDELTPDERAAIGALPREALPPTSLEDATVAALRARGLLAPARSHRRWRGIQMLAGLAAAMALFLGGLLLGRRGSPAAEAGGTGPRFMLLLYEGPAYAQPPAGQEQSRVKEYGAWARASAAGGEIQGGEKLRDAAPEVMVSSDGGVTTTPPDLGATRLTGFFLIRATDQGAALAIAKSCPHVRYGGSIVIREIEPT